MQWLKAVKICMISLKFYNKSGQCVTWQGNYFPAPRKVLWFARGAGGAGRSAPRLGSRAEPGARWDAAGTEPCPLGAPFVPLGGREAAFSGCPTETWRPCSATDRGHGWKPVAGLPTERGCKGAGMFLGSFAERASRCAFKIIRIAWNKERETLLPTGPLVFSTGPLPSCSGLLPFPKGDVVNYLGT